MVHIPRFIHKSLITLTLAVMVVSAFAGRIDLATMVTPRYTVEGDAFVRHNGDRFCNRPLYCNHIYAIVLAGDKPFAMVGKQANILGNLMFALVRNGKGTWLQNASDITSKYRPGRMEWIVKDAAWGATADSSRGGARREGHRDGRPRADRERATRR